MQLFKDNQLLFFQINFQQMPVFCGLHGLHMFYLFQKVYGARGGEQDTVLNVGPVAISDWPLCPLSLISVRTWPNPMTE